MSVSLTKASKHPLPIMHAEINVNGILNVGSSLEARHVLLGEEWMLWNDGCVMGFVRSMKNIER